MTYTATIQRPKPRKPFRVTFISLHGRSSHLDTEINDHVPSLHGYPRLAGYIIKRNEGAST